MTRDQVVADLKSKALNGSTDEIGSFSQSAYDKALTSIGDQKLAALFSPGGLETLKRIGRVAGYTMAAPKGSAVNGRNMAASVMNLLSGLSGHVGTWPDVNIAAKSFREFQQAQMAKNALMAQLQPEAYEAKRMRSVRSWRQRRVRSACLARLRSDRTATTELPAAVRRMRREVSSIDRVPLSLTCCAAVCWNVELGQLNCQGNIGNCTT